MAIADGSALDVGMIWVHSENVRHVSTPFGGTTDSGIGGDGCDYAADFSMETKTICLAMRTHGIQKLGA